MNTFHFLVVPFCLFYSFAIILVIIGTGVMVTAVMTASRRAPIIMGKPEKPMIDAIRSMYVIQISNFELCRLVHLSYMLPIR